MGNETANALKAIPAMIVLFLLTSAPSAQAKPQKPQPSSTSAAADRLGLTCAKILEMNSIGWVAKFDAEKLGGPEGAARAIAVYGKCYDARTDALAASLAKKGAGPPKTARANFLGFENALHLFVAKALDDAQPRPDTTKVAYVHLYEKQFRFEFYQAYAAKNLNRSLTPEENDQFGKAKNRFGELLGLLPEDQAHEVHEAFGEIVGTHALSLPTKLALYRYAILILEPLSEKPFAPPAF